MAIDQSVINFAVYEDSVEYAQKPARVCCREPERHGLLCAGR